MAKPNEEYRRTLQKVKELAQEGYQQRNYYRLEDILREIGEFENDDHPLNY